MKIEVLRRSVSGAAVLLVALSVVGCATSTTGHHLEKGDAEKNMAAPTASMARPVESRITKKSQKKLSVEERKKLVEEYKALMNDI